jgi:hypothetical protein
LNQFSSSSLHEYRRLFFKVNDRYCHMFFPLRPPQSTETTRTAGISNMGETTPSMMPMDIPNSQMATGVTIAIVRMTQNRIVILHFPVEVALYQIHRNSIITDWNCLCDRIRQRLRMRRKMQPGDLSSRSAE